MLSVPVVTSILIVYTKYYIRTYWDLVRMDSVTNSPILTHVGETISGTSTIWAYKKQDYYT